MTIKGAPDILIGRCSNYLTPTGLLAPLDDSALANFEQTKATYSSQGKRCLLLARKIVPAGSITAPTGTIEYENIMTENAKQDLTIVGLVAIVDPLRPEIPNVVSTLRGAGIRISMVC